MMRYVHKKTGAVIDIASVLHSPDWEIVPEDAANAEKPSASAKEVKPKPHRKAVKADGENLRTDQ
jgi:hypothetical protein